MYGQSRKHVNCNVSFSGTDRSTHQINGCPGPGPGPGPGPDPGSGINDRLFIPTFRETFVPQSLPFPLKNRKCPVSAYSYKTVEIISYVFFFKMKEPGSH
ncbi:hypothetical protein V6N13_001806 [Hibiscus sabdariffa]|uniref:Uncharacterized protein n=1 Tax=Hibiscus sabdariffa TaxID=183260 RepID=A0ABR2GAA7_9ROSI